MDIGKDLQNANLDGIKYGFEKSIEIINTEIEYAKQVNSQMALGMIQVRELIEKELDKTHSKY